MSNATFRNEYAGALRLLLSTPFVRLFLGMCLVAGLIGCKEEEKTKTLHAKILFPDGAKSGTLVCEGREYTFGPPESQSSSYAEVDFQVSKNAAGVVSVSFEAQPSNDGSGTGPLPVYLNIFATNEKLEHQTFLAEPDDHLVIDERSTVATLLLLSPSLMNMPNWMYMSEVIPLIESNANLDVLVSMMENSTDYETTFANSMFQENYNSVIESVVGSFPTIEVQDRSGLVDVSSDIGVHANVSLKNGRFETRKLALNGMPVQLEGIDFTFYTFYTPEKKVSQSGDKYVIEIVENVEAVNYPWPLDDISWRGMEGIAEIAEVNPWVPPFDGNPNWKDQVRSLSWRERTGLVFERYSGTSQTRPVPSNNWLKSIDPTKYASSWLINDVISPAVSLDTEVPMKIDANRPGLYVVRVYTGGLGSSALGLGTDRSWEFGELLPNISPGIIMSRGQELWIRALFLNIVWQALNTLVALDPDVLGKVLSSTSQTIIGPVINESIEQFMAKPWSDQSSFDDIVDAATDVLKKILEKALQNFSKAATEGAFKMVGIAVDSLFSGLKRFSAGMQAAGWLVQFPFNPPVETFVIQVGDPFLTPPVCGDDICEPSENIQNCPLDCGERCGDGICSGH